MIKFCDTLVVFQEIPNKITLAINISNCQNNCPGCHSPYLKEDIGEELTPEVLDRLISTNKGINCICFMGEGKDHNGLLSLAEYLKATYPEIARGIYSGREKVEEDIYNAFDYVKVGPYIAELGPLNKKTTNQRLYEHGEDITYKFWERNGNLTKEEN